MGGIERSHRREMVLAGALILSIGALYTAIVLALAPYRSFWSGDGGVKFWQMRAWIVNGWRTPWASYADVNVALDPQHRLAPLEPPFAVWNGDRVLTIYTSPYLFLSSLLLAKWGHLALYAPPLVAGVAGLALEWWMGRRFSSLVARVAVPVLGLATPWLFYSVVFWEHTVASLLVWVALALLLLDAGTPQPRLIAGVVAGLCLWAAMAARPEASVCALALAIVLAAQCSAWALLAWMLVGLGLGSLAGWAYRINVVGEAMVSQVTANLASSSFDLWSVERLFRTSQMVVESRHLGVLVILVGAGAAISLAWVYRMLFSATGALFGRIAECVGLVLVAIGAVVLLFRGHKPIDLLTGAPVFCLLCVRGSGRAEESTQVQHRWKRRLAWWCALVVVLSVALAPNDGGSWGPRYLTPVLGPLVLLSVAAWERLERGSRYRLSKLGVRLAFVALTVAGVLVGSIGVVRLWQTRVGNARLSRLLLSPPAAVVVTDLWFVPQIAPEVYGQAPVFLVRTADEWRELDRRLVEQNVERVRVVRLAGYETPLVESVAEHWQVLRNTPIEEPAMPLLTVVDYVPKEP